MRTLLAICIMALAAPASARPWAAFYCGDLQIALIPSKYFNPEFGSCTAPCDGKSHYFDMKKDPDQKRPLSSRLFREDGAGVLFYKGIKCQEFTGDDYDAPPGMSRREIARQRRLRLLSVPASPPMPITTCVPHPTMEGYTICGQPPASDADRLPPRSAKPQPSASIVTELAPVPMIPSEPDQWNHAAPGWQAAAEGGALRLSGDAPRSHRC